VSAALIGGSRRARRGVSRISGCAAGLALVLLLSGVTESATAQATPVDTGAAMTGPGGPRRQMLEQRLRQRFEQIVRQRLQLTDDQMQKLRQTNQRFAAQRRALTEQERGLRSEIRRELQPGVAANQTHVAALTDSLFAIQRQRLDVGDLPVARSTRTLLRFAGAASAPPGDDPPAAAGRTAGRIAGPLTRAVRAIDILQFRPG
jgi:hypothetical protein